jgi:hypothetical protein
LQPGRKLVAGGDLVRFTFDAGSKKAKMGIEQLVKHFEMGHSEFFSSLIAAAAMN